MSFFGDGEKSPSWTHGISMAYQWHINGMSKATAVDMPLAIVSKSMNGFPRVNGLKGMMVYTCLYHQRTTSKSHTRIRTMKVQGWRQRNRQDC